MAGLQALRRGREDQRGDRLSRRAGRRLAGGARQGDRPDGHAARALPLAQGLSRRLRALRRLHRQVPLLPRHRRPEEHAGRAPGPDAQRLPALLHARRQDRSRSWSARATSRAKCSTSGTPTTTSARSAGAARCSAPTASTPPRSPWPGREILDDVGYGQKYSNEIIGKVHRIGNNLGLPGPALARHARGARGGRQGRDRRRRALSARPEGRRDPAGHAVGRLLRRAARRQPDRLRQGVPRGRRQLDAVLARLRGGQLRPVHRQLRADARHRDAHPRGGARTRREAHRRRRMRPRLARRLQLLEHAGRHRRRRARTPSRSQLQSQLDCATASRCTSASSPGT